MISKIKFKGTLGKVIIARLGCGRQAQILGRKRPHCHLCEDMEDTCTFKSKHLDETHKINNKYNYNSKMEVSLIECQIYGEQYKRSIKVKFRSRANNYKVGSESL